jgi:tetratricopeptide (TPR) repeat protein
LAHAGKKSDAEAIEARYSPVNPSGFDAERAAIDALFPKTDSAVALNERALGLMGERKYDEALDLLNQSLKINPSNHFVHTNIAIIRAARGDNAGSLAEHNEAVRLAPDDPSPYYWRSRLYLKQNDFASAIRDLQAAADRSHRDIHETAPLVECLLRAGRASEAQGLMDEAEKAGKAEAMAKERAAVRAAVFGEH